MAPSDPRRRARGRDHTGPPEAARESRLTFNRRARGISRPQSRSCRARPRGCLMPQALGDSANPTAARFNRASGAFHEGVHRLCPPPHHRRPRPRWCGLPPRPRCRGGDVGCVRRRGDGPLWYPLRGGVGVRADFRDLHPERHWGTEKHVEPFRPRHLRRALGVSPSDWTPLRARRVSRRCRWQRLFFSHAPSRWGCV